MSRPYDTVLRIRRRETDDYGIAIAGAREQLDQLGRAIASRGEEMKRQGHASVADPLLSSHAYLSRLRRERSELVKIERHADAALDALRDRAAQAFAAMRATEESADEHEQEVQRAVGRKEQSEADDLAGSRLVRNRR
ncbi:MAG: hypothetical protein JWO25_2916 [Alphaproteobacteria bacterium]|nr:hypothetical protein [Alphaproteobacteria bacterium]